MTARPTVHIAAGGKGTRIQEVLQSPGFPHGIPKQLLPTGSGETLLGRIVRQIHTIGHAAIHTSYQHARLIGENVDVHLDADLLIDRHPQGPLGPLVRNLQLTDRQALSCAGDFWADFKWKDFLAFHEGHDTPVSILVARSVPTTEGARFDVGSDGVVTAWERVSRTTEEDLINIGAYIVDPEKLVLKKFRELGGQPVEQPFKEDHVNTAMIAGRLMSAYVLDGVAFNVNNPLVYTAMFQYTSPPN